MERATAHRADESWSMDFMSDELYNGQRIKLLTLVDNFTRESLAIEVDERMGSQRVMEILMQVAEDRLIRYNECRGRINGQCNASITKGLKCR